MNLRTLLCTLLATVGAVLPAWGVELTPFATRNLLPTVIVHQLAYSEKARLNDSGQLSARFGFDIASTASDSQNDEEILVLDGETYVATLGLRYGVADNMQIGIEVPWVWQSKGFLDDFIENFHDFFGMPNGDRNNMSNNEINYSYSNTDGDDFLLDHEANSIGDLRLLGAWQWLDSEELAASLHATVKAPTGDADKFTGSGGWDVSLAVSLQRDYTLEKGRAALWGGLGGSWLGDGDILKDDTKNWAGSAWLGAGWSPLNWLALKVQFDGHTALYDGNLHELDNPALLLTMGGTLGLTEKTTLDIGVGEDLVVNSSPDVIFHFALNHSF